MPLATILALVSPLMGHLARRIGSRVPLTIGPQIVGCVFLIATALLGAKGPGLISGFHTIALACAIASTAAGASAFFIGAAKGHG